MDRATKQRKSPTRLTPGKLLIITTLVGILVSMGIVAYQFLLSSDSTKSTGTNITTSTQTLAKHYMQAFINHGYYAMWSQLHPDVQATWPNEQAFAIYYKNRFQDYTLHGFTLGQTKALSAWTNPETMMTYTQVVQIPISLQLDPKSPSQQLPPENLHPSQLFENVPFVVQYSNDTRYKHGEWVVLNSGPADIEAPILPPVIPAAQKVQVPILMYHHISDTPTHNVLDRSLTVTPTVFSQQLDHLKARGYHSITFNQLFATLYYGSPLPSKPIILTFDDGYEDAYHFAYPLLKAHGFSGMFYIITGKVGWDGQMSWSQIRTILSNGMQVGSHTIHHVDMGRVLLNSPEQAQQEVQISRSTLQQNLGIIVQQFCYPSGEPFRHGSQALRQSVIQLLTKNGYIGATTDPGMTGTEQDSQHPFMLLRLRIDGRSTLENFTTRLL